MNTVKNFGDFNITRKRSFEGPKCYPEDVLNQELVVEFFEIKPSKKENCEACLHCQISIGGQKRLLFSGSTWLMNEIKQIPADSFPFRAMIVKVNKHFEFRQPNK